MIMKQLLYIILFAFALLTSCRKEQPKMPNGLTDCGCAEETSADFKIEEFWGDINEYYLRTETDTSYTNKNIYFTAKHKNSQYKWYIGTEILTDSVVGRFFSNSAVENQTIPITLVVKKKPNTICFPNDDGVDSITKYIHFVKFPENTGAFQPFPLNMAGTYRVKMPHLPDSQEITIACVMNEFNYDQLLGVTNYDGYGSNIDIPVPLQSNVLKLYRKNYSEIQMGEGPSFSVGNYFYGFLRRNVNTNQYEFDISLGGASPTNPNYVKRKYLGRKIN